MAGKRKTKKAEGPKAVVFALSHPTRISILELLGDGRSSPKRISDRLDESLANVSYHTGVLLECGAIKPAGTRKVRGAVEHFYEATVSTFLETQILGKIPATLRSTRTIVELRALVEEVLTGLENEVVELTDHSAMDSMAILVDQAGRNQARDLSETTMAQFRVIHEQSGKRAKVSKEELTRMIVGIAAFRTHPPGEPLPD